MTVRLSARYPKHLYWSWVVSPICNLLLGVLGVLPIRVNYGESQKLRIRLFLISHLIRSTEVNASDMSLSAIKSGDVIISNFHGLSPDPHLRRIVVFPPPLNRRASDRFGFINNQVHVLYLLNAGRRHRMRSPDSSALCHVADALLLHPSGQAAGVADGSLPAGSLRRGVSSLSLPRRTSPRTTAPSSSSLRSLRPPTPRSPIRCTCCR